MLNSRYLANLSDDLVELYSDLEFQIKKDIFKRLAKLKKITDKTEYQLEVLNQVGGLKSGVIELVDKYNLKSKKLLLNLYIEAMEKATNQDIKYFALAKRELSPDQKQVLTTSIDRFKADFPVINKTYSAIAESKEFKAIYESLVRMTLTVADNTEKKFITEMNKAYMKVSSGAFSWSDAYTTAIKDLAKEGVRTVLYTGSGKIVERSIESACRMNILTGINQTASMQTIENADSLGTDLVEVSAHIGARPEHEAVQGRVFCLRGERDYRDENGEIQHALNFEKECRFGEADGICGINCRHSFYPYFEGSPLTYSNKQLDEYKEQKVRLDNKLISPYEAEQDLRLCERNIRLYKSEALGFELTDKTEDPAYLEAKRNIGRWQESARHIVKETGIERKYINELIGTPTGKQPTGIK